jgi:aspartate aminotransferase
VSRISHRVDQIKPSATIVVSMKAMQLKARGMDIVSLGFGEPDFDTPAHIREAAIAAIHGGKTRYTEVDGTPELKRAIIDKFRRDNELNFEPKQILVSNGAKQSLFNLLIALLNRGDEVIVPAPYWVSYPDMVKLTEAEPAILPATAEHDYKITAGELQNTLNENTRLIILNSPSNPTGKVYSEKVYRELGEVLFEHPEVFIACDDIYEHIYWGRSSYRTFLNACPELTERANGRN